MRRGLAFGALALVAACSSGGHTAVEKGAQPQACADIKAGAPVLKSTIDNGCTEPSGDTFAFTTVDCKDGRVFTTYDDKLRGFVGGVWKTGASGSDPAYAKDYATCQG